VTSAVHSSTAPSFFVPLSPSLLLLAAICIVWLAHPVAVQAAEPPTRPAGPASLSIFAPSLSEEATCTQPTLRRSAAVSACGQGHLQGQLQSPAPILADKGEILRVLHAARNFG